MIAEYAREVLGLFPRGRLLVGVDGIEHPETAPPSVRERFATDLAAAFAAEGAGAAAVPLARWTASDPPRDPAVLADRLYDVDAFRAEVVDPFRAGRPVPAAGGSGLGDRAVLVVSGIFLHHPAVAPLWHTSAWLAMPRAVARRLDEERLHLGPEVGERWGAAVDRSFALLDARKRSQASFDATDPEHPRRVFEDAC